MAVRVVEQMAKEIENLDVIRLRLGRFFQRLDGLVVAVEHREAAGRAGTVRRRQPRPA
jgi:hypothetical protein